MGHVWKFLSGHGQDAPGQSLDTYEQCALCGVVRHDYRHGGGMTSPNYPVFFKLGHRHPIDAPCEGNVIGRLREWIDARITACRATELKFSNAAVSRGPMVSQTMIEAWTERRTLEDVLGMLPKEKP